MANLIELDAFYTWLSQLPPAKMPNVAKQVGKKNWICDLRIEDHISFFFSMAIKAEFLNRRPALRRSVRATDTPISPRMSGP